MNPSFTRGEYWLIETAVTLAIPVSSLLDVEIDVALNKPGHGMDRLQIQAALESLSRRGIISFRRAGPNGDKPATVTEVGAALDETRFSPERLYYELTVDGGAQWEAFAAPDWDLFVDHSCSTDDEENWRYELAGARRERLQRYFDGLHYVGIHPKAGTVRWTELTPWQATYWKQLSKGYRVEFASGPEESFQFEDMPLKYYWLYSKRWYRWS